MKKYFTNFISIIFIIFILICFNLSRIKTLPSYKILKIGNPDEFYLDLNNNNKIDENELVKIYDISVFKNKKDYKTKYQIKSTNLTMPELLCLGIEAKDFAEKNFNGKFVKVEFVDSEVSKNQNFLTAKLYLNNKDISKIYLNEGFAVSGKKETSYKKELNYIKLSEKVKSLNLDDFVVVNDKNHTYHHPNCKYAKELKTAYAIKKTELTDNLKPCPHCILHNKKLKHSNEQEQTNFVIKNFDFKSSSLNFYFTDFNKRIKPDNTCSTAGCKVLLENINAAKTSIDFAMYGIDNQPKIITALENAKKRGVKIRWVTDSDTNGQNIYKEVITIQKILPDFKTDNSHIYGDKVKNSKYVNSIMHNKFFIFDDKYVWLGTANISKTDLADFNANIIIFSKSNVLAAIYKQEFEQMYNEKFHNLKQPIKNKENIKIDDINSVSVYFSPTDKITTTKIVPKIQNAQKYIYISSFIITHSEIKAALINAEQRGVDIKIITDATSASGKYSIHKELRKNNIKVKVENKAGKMHTKSLIIDDKYTFVGSMNLTKSGENKNDENVILFYNPNIAKIFKEQFLYLWGSIPEKWLTKNPRAESRDSYGSCFDGIDNNFDGDIDSADKGCKLKTK